MKLPLLGVAQTVAQHLGSYVELACSAAGEYRVALRRRLVLAIATMVVATVTLLAAWGTGLLLVWDSPWRAVYAVGSTCLGCLATALLFWLAMRREAPGPERQTLRDEVALDMDLLREWRQSL